MKRNTEKNLYGLFFLSPYLVLVVLFLIVPLALAVYMSFTEYSLIWGGLENAKFVGFKNYMKLFKDPVFLVSLKNTFTFVLFSLPLQLVMSFVLAYLLNSKCLKARGTYRTVFYIPTFTSAVAITLIFSYLFQSNGLINKMISMFTPFSENWLDSVSLIKIPVVTMYSWIKVGIYMLIYINGLASIPESFYETMELEGGRFWHKLKMILIPSLSNITYFIITMILIDSFKLFDIPNIISKGTAGPLNATLTTVIYVYKQAFSAGRMGYASAASLLLFVIIFVVSKIQGAVKEKMS